MLPASTDALTSTARPSDRALALVLDGSALAIVFTLSLLLLMDVKGPERVILALAFTVFVPGRAIVSNWPAARDRSQIALSVVLSISILVVVSAVALWLHLWHPLTLFAVEALTSAAAIAPSFRRSVRTTSSWGPSDVAPGALVDDEPVWVGQLELTTQDLRSVCHHQMSEYRQARILVRLRGYPLGFLALPVPDHGLVLSDVVEFARTELYPQIRAYLQADGALPDNGSRSQLSGPAGLAATCRSGTVPPISVVICTHARPVALRDCLESLRRISYECFEGIIVDNAPLGDETRLVFDDVLGDDSRFSYLVEPIQGLSRARNRGLAAARFGKVAFTDDDVVVDPAWLQGLARGFLREPGVVCVTGLVPAGSLETAAERYFAHRVSWADHLQPRRYDSAGRQSPHFPFDVALFGTGANFASDRCALVNVGGFDEALGAGTEACGGEDLDIFVRLLLAGGILAYEPSAIVWHFRNTQNDELLGQMRRYGVGFAAHVLKELRSPAVRHGVLRHFPGIIAEVTRRWFGHSRAVPRGREYVAAEISGWLRGPLAYHRSRRTLERRGAVPS